MVGEEGVTLDVLPRVMRRLITDRSPEPFLDAGVPYNQFIEGRLPIGGYRVWDQLFAQTGVMPGLCDGLTWVQRDERRHIAYGTYLRAGVIAANPELLDFARRRMPATFAVFAQAQIRRRLEVLEKALTISVAEAKRGGGADEAESESDSA